VTIVWSLVGTGSLPRPEAVRSALESASLDPLAVARSGGSTFGASSWVKTYSCRLDAQAPFSVICEGYDRLSCPDEVAEEIRALTAEIILDARPPWIPACAALVRRLQQVAWVVYLHGFGSDGWSGVQEAALVLGRETGAMLRVSDSRGIVDWEGRRALRS
jgi:hypothetical protein